MKKVTATIARALAEQCLHQIKEVREKQLSTRKALALASPEVKEVIKIRKEEQRLQVKAKSLIRAVEEKFDLQITAHTDASISAYQRRDTLPSVDVLKNEIIIHNHVNEMDSAKAVSAIIKQYTKQKVG